LDLAPNFAGVRVRDELFSELFSSAPSLDSLFFALSALRRAALVGAFAALTAERSGAWKIGESALFAGAAGALSLAGAFLATFFTAAFLAAGD
jgi:hypothetical protein